MRKRTEADALSDTIRLLQNKQEQELILLKEQIHLVSESLKPINLIKSSWHDLTSAPDVKTNVVNNAIGLSTGFLSRKILFNASRNPIKNVLGAILQFVVGNVVSKHSDKIRSTGKIILKSVFKNKNEDKREFSDNGN